MGLIDIIKTTLGIGELIPIEKPRGMWAFYVTTWIGSGKEFSEKTQELLDKGASHRDFPNEGPQRPNLPDYIGYMEDVTGQFVHLVKGSPSPNIVVVKIGELREKHRGSLSQLAVDTCGVMLERQWEPEGAMVKQVLDEGIQNWLKAQGISHNAALSVTGIKRTEQVVMLARACVPEIVEV